MVDGDDALTLEGFCHFFFGGYSSFYCLLMLEGAIISLYYHLYNSKVLFS
jgi:hypothetical protein